ncbi:NAD(P)-binding protein [Auricularia subglabra TFB-10046 SS5]|nr:NAD(P)-binding protein [Auricularia subglabra TFB-10046 SS5]
MSTLIKTVVVHGATGRQGGSAVRSLTAAGFKVRAAVRDANTPKARELAASPDVELAVINLEDVSTLVKAYTGADAVFGVTVPPGELPVGKDMADAAKAANVKLFVWSALDPVTKKTNGEISVPHWDEKAEVSDYLSRIGVPHTILFVGAFMENYVYFPGHSSYDEKEDAITITYGGGKPETTFPMVRIEKDTGEALRIILSHPEDFINKEVVLAPNRLTVQQQADIIAKLSGRKARVGEPMRTPFIPGLDNMYDYVNDPRFGMYSDREIPDPLLEKHGFKPATFESFVEEQLLPHLKL